MNSKRSTYDGYSRVSQTSGRAGSDSFISPAVQEEKVRGWAALHDIQLGRMFEDLDQTGGTMDRPAFNEALARIAGGESKGLVVAKLDRFGRNAAEADATIKAIEAAGGEVVSVAEQLDTRTPMGKAMRRILLTFAEMELDQRKEDWLVAKRRAVERGVKPGLAPVGYTREPTGRTTRRGAPEMGPLVVHEQEAAHIHHAFELSAGAGGLGAAQAYMQEAFPDRQMTVTVVEKILANAIYTGMLRHGDFVQHFPALEVVDQITWDLAQHGARAVERRTKLLPIFPLAGGIARCGSCEGPLAAQNARDWRAYRCRNPLCTERVHVVAGPLERMVLDRIRANPPSASTDEMLQRAADVLVKSDALRDAVEARERYAELDELDRWAERVAERTAELAAARMIADLPYQVELPDLGGDLTPVELRAVFQRAVEKLAVLKGRAPLVERVDLTLRA